MASDKVTSNIDFFYRCIYFYKEYAYIYLSLNIKDMIIF